MKRNVILIGTIFMVGLALLTSCKKEHCDCEYGSYKGTVVFTGAPEVDGCGWLIRIDSVNYHPVNLSKDYQIDGLMVTLKYEKESEGYRCGRGSSLIPSIRIVEIHADAEEVGILGEDEWDQYKMDPFRMDSAYVKGDYLYIRVGYSGGCARHDFSLWKLPPNALNPPPIELALSHDSHGDLCEAYFTRWLVFSLIPIRQRGVYEVNFLLRGSPEMSAYFGQYTYSY
ncbi:MAG: hypothetical protein PHY99_04480 [Bacteroidales bacterium]|nr:hypothetical protein [Bacteroidales bacterium]